MLKIDIPEMDPLLLVGVIRLVRHRVKDLRCVTLLRTELKEGKVKVSTAELESPRE